MRTEAERFWQKVIKTKSGCWLWVAAKTKDGYGQFGKTSKRGKRGKVVKAHRWSYEVLVGPIPPRKVLHHKCEVRSCVRPKHLTPKTSKQNTEAGNGPTAINARKKSCKRGHPLTGSNLHVYPDGRRGCRTCESDQKLAYYHRTQGKNHHRWNHRKKYV